MTDYEKILDEVLKEEDKEYTYPTPYTRNYYKVFEKVKEAGEEMASIRDSHNVWLD